jgi:hypothetical protein
LKQSLWNLFRIGTLRLWINLRGRKRRRGYSLFHLRFHWRCLNRNSTPGLPKAMHRAAASEPLPLIAHRMKVCNDAPASVSQSRPGLAAWPLAHDRAIPPLTRRALDLDPIAPRAGQVRPIGAFSHNALATQVSDAPEHEVAPGVQASPLLRAVIDGLAGAHGLFTVEAAD